MKKIIWCGNSYYGSPFKVGCNYYSEILAKQGNKVLFISPPISPFHNKSGNELRFDQAKKGIFEAFNNYFVYTPYTFLPPIQKLPLAFFSVIKNWFKFTKPNLITQLKKINFLEVDILVIDYFAFLPLIYFIKYKKLIVRVTDNIKNFGVGKSTIIAERILLEKANKIIVSSYRLIEYAKKFNSNVFYVPNGVDFDKFQGKFEKPIVFNKINKPIAIYVGAIEKWFDFELLNYTVEKLQDIHFFIIGPIKYTPTYFKKLKNKDNITFFGKIYNLLVPNYLHYASVGIIPFKSNIPLVQTISPLKLYEYMACGLPVVSVEWEELKHIKSPAFLAKTKEEFVNNIRIALQDKNREKYKNFARENDWKKKLKCIISE